MKILINLITKELLISELINNWRRFLIKNILRINNRKIINFSPSIFLIFNYIQGKFHQIHNRYSKYWNKNGIFSIFSISLPRLLVSWPDYYLLFLSIEQWNHWFKDRSSYFTSLCLYHLLYSPFLSTQHHQ